MVDWCGWNAESERRDKMIDNAIKENSEKFTSFFVNLKIKYKYNYVLLL